MLDDCDFHFDCKGCGGRGVVGGVYRSVVTCSDCGGFGFERKVPNDIEEPETTFEAKVVAQSKRVTIQDKLSPHQRRWLEMSRNPERYFRERTGR